MNHTLHNTHVKLLAFDLLSLTQTSGDPTVFCRKGVPLSRIETVGTVTSSEHKPDKFLKFLVDDGTASISCILWLNHFNSPYFARRNPTDLRIIANMAKYYADVLMIGSVARVRGKITSYKGAVQITVSDVVIERDPNIEILHWLDCIRLARRCYDIVPRSA